MLTSYCWQVSYSYFITEAKFRCLYMFIPGVSHYSLGALWAFDHVNSQTDTSIQNHRLACQRLSTIFTNLFVPCHSLITNALYLAQRISLQQEVNEFSWFNVGALGDWINILCRIIDCSSLAFNAHCKLHWPRQVLWHWPSTVTLTHCIE